MHWSLPDSMKARLAAAALLAFTFPVHAQTAEATAEQGQPLKLFESNETLAVDITAPWRRLLRSPSEERYPGKLSWTDETGRQNSVDITVERRGITRQQVCQFPPIRLRMEKEAVKGTTFRGQDSLKMVTHCDKGDRWEQYYVKEMLAYQFYNRVTDISHRVRPLTVNYVESEGGASQSGRFAFLIEDDGDVAKRHGLKKLELPDIEPEQLEAAHASRFALFQYMIGNVDWSSLTGPGSLRCCHNARLLGPENATTELIPLPYDFDSSGLVDAHYAAPNEGMPIRTVTERFFRGFCVHNATLQEARQQYLAMEPEFLSLLSNEERLSGRSEKVATRYLGDFYAILKDDGKFDKEIIRKCRK